MKIGIYGYGNLGKGVELAIRQNPDMELFGVFTRRDPKTVKTLTGAPVYAAEEAEEYADEIDAMIICGGSASDLPEMTPMLVRNLMWWIPLIPTRGFPSISPMWTRRRLRMRIRRSSAPDGIQGCSPWPGCT